LKDYPAPTFSLFIGLILASAWFIWKNIDEFSPVAIFTCIIGGMMGILISLVPISAEGGQTLVSVFFLGVVSICAMLLPGISGSYILLMFGHYEYIIGALHDLNLQILGVFAVGATIGLLLFSRLISWMLRQVKNETFAFLMGLMLGALTRPGQEVLAELHTTTVFAFSLFFLLLGIILVLWLERFSEKGNNELWV
ncbi:DUF368 domain-containing protein, partial [Candidatus Woesearchaeota archaeon]|nr:DUF368 domain-containing protein [Candidatus Woesearchaeota archaeon]